MIGVWYRNSIEAVEANLAVEWAGLTRIMVDPNAQADEAQATFRAGGVELALADKEHARLLEGEAVVHDRDEWFLGERAAPAEEVSGGQPLCLYPRSVTNGQLFAIPFSYGNWDAILRTNVDLYRSDRFGVWAEEEEVLLAAQQIMHATGLVGTFPFLMMGRPQILVDQFVADRVLEAMVEHRVTTTMLVPQMLNKLVDAAEQKGAGAPSLRHVLYGGGPIAPTEIRRAVHHLGPVLSQIYGRMEGGWPISVLDTEDHAAIGNGDDRLATSCGRPVDAVEVRLRSIASSGKGELLVSSDMTVEEYKGDDGFCSLGDIMEIDGRGYLFYRGRLDRMINTGYHVYPDEIEEILRGVPGVVDVIVKGESSVEWGETVVACLVIDRSLDPDVLVATAKSAVAKKLARYKVPRKFLVVDRLPTNEADLRACCAARPDFESTG